MNKELLKAIQLRENGMLKEANSLLLELVHTYPSDAEIHYHCAWSFDVLGEETKAVPYYEKAIALGLSDDALQGALLGLGSTYRTIGDYVSSKRVLKKRWNNFQAIEHTTFSTP